MNKDYTRFLASTEIEAVYEMPVAALVKDYESGMGIVKLSEKYDVSQHRVRKLLHDNGVSLRKPGIAAEVISDHTLSSMIADYENGEGLPELCKRYGLSHGKVWHRFKSRGVTMRPKGARFNHRPIVQSMIDSYKAGKSLKEIEAELGISTSTIRRKLRAAGVILHPTGPRTKAAVTA